MYFRKNLFQIEEIKQNYFKAGLQNAMIWKHIFCWQKKKKEKKPDIVKTHLTKVYGQ